MESVLLGFALLLLIAPGMLFVMLIGSGNTERRFSLLVGYGIAVGLLAVPLVMRLLDALALPLSFPVTSSAIIVLSGVLLFKLTRDDRSLTHNLGIPGETFNTTFFHRALIVLLISIIALRVGGLAVDVLFRPLFPWDATMHWATKGRVWFEFLEIMPFVENEAWLNSVNPEVFTDHHPSYPSTIPLLQLWMALSVGRWDESLINLPWVLCLIGLAFAFYGQAREAGSEPVTSLLFAYFLVSMPLLNTHVALAGYADLFLGASYCLAIMAFHNWTISRTRFQALLATLFALSCVLIKNEGLFWLATFVPAMLLALLPLRKAVPVLLGIMIATVAVLAIFPRDFVVAGHSLEQLNLYYRPGALKAIFTSLFLHDNWHLFAYLVAGLVAASLLFQRSILRECLPLIGALGAAACLFLFLFVFTAYSGGALGFTAVGRISLQLVPAFMYLCLLLATGLLDLDNRHAGTEVVR